MNGRRNDRPRWRRHVWGGVLAGLCGLCLLANVAGAAVYVVDGNHPDAADTNPGTLEAPLKTLSRAGERARPGDRVTIRGGVYRETLRVIGPRDDPADDPALRRWTVEGSPAPADRIVFEAYGDEAVTIDGSEAVPPALWHPVDGRSGLYAVSLADAFAEVARAENIDLGTFEPGYVFWRDERILAHRERDAQGLWQFVAPTADDAPAWHFDKTQGVFYVHLGGADPRADDGRVELAIRTVGVTGSGLHNVTFRKLTVRRTTSRGFSAAGRGLVIEDCMVTHARWFGIAAGSPGIVVRRNFVYDVDGRGIDSGGSLAPLIIDNVVADFSLAERGYYNYAYMVFAGKFNQFYHNIALQSERRGVGGGGFWTDCPGVGHIWMGNAAVRCNFYIESPAFNNLVQWNTVTRFRNQAIYLRANASNLVRENLVEQCGTALVLGSTDTPRHDVAGNVFVLNWLKQNRTGISVGSERGRTGVQRRNFAQGNVYEPTDDGIIGAWAGRSFRTLEEFQVGAEQESMGRVGTIDYADIGVAWVRADVPGERHIPFPIVMNPQFSRDGTRCGVEPYFWRRGDATGADVFPHGWAARHQLRHDAHPGWADERARPFARSAQQGLSRWPMVGRVEGTPVEGKVLHLASMQDGVLDARGVGCWSPSLPTVPGAEIEVALWMKPTDIAPAADGGGAVVYFEWSDWTGQNKSRGYLVGGETDVEILRPEFSRGTRAWGRVSGRVTAPAQARRFALYLGLRSATGEVMFDAVDTLRTLPGEPPEPAAEATEPEPESRPLVDPATLTFTTLDLADWVNRALADEQADDGQGGWTDQGPGYDMPDLETGRQEHEGVPYMLLAPKTCVVLRSHRRPQSPHLPEQVDLPVGDRARVLYFLHTGAWVEEGRTQWTYEMDYADGERAEMPVIGGVNVRDWGEAGEPYAFPNTDARRTTVWPQLVANIISPTCGLYVMEWLNPRPDAEIREIRMTVSPRAGVPILLAVTIGQDREAD